MLEELGPEELGPEELDPDELGPEFDIPAPPLLPMSPVPCANATGAPISKAAIATEYFNIFFSFVRPTERWS
jgi:hypothetical protein